MKTHFLWAKGCCRELKSLAENHSKINLRFSVKDLLRSTTEQGLFFKITFPAKQMLKLSCGENTRLFIYNFPKTALARQDPQQHRLLPPLGVSSGTDIWAERHGPTGLPLILPA